MLRKLNKSVLMAALLLSIIVLAGCTKMVRVPITEVNIPQPITISAVKLLAGKRLAFDKNGARYHPHAKLFQGITVDNHRQNVNISDADSVYFTIAGDSTQYIQPGRAFEKEQKQLHRDTVKGKIVAVETAHALFKFSGNNTRIDSLNHVIVGIAKNNDSLRVPLESVLSLKVKRPDHLKNGILLAGIGLLIYSIATFEPISDDFELNWNSN